MTYFAHYPAKNHAIKNQGGGQSECSGGGKSGGVAVDWRWIDGGEVEGVEGRVAVVVKWGLDKWRWQSCGSGGGGESGGKGNPSVVVVVRGVELRWIGGGLVVARSRVLAVEWQ